MHHQDEVRPWRHPVALLHGVIKHGPRLERLQPVGALAVQRNLDQRGQPGAQQRCQPVGVQHRDFAFDQPRVPQPLDAPQAGRRRHMHPLGQRLVAQAGIALQAFEQFEVNRIEFYFFHEMIIKEI